MKNSLTIALLFVISFCSAQQNVYQKVSELLKQNNPELIIEGKLLVVNFDRSPSQINKTLYSQLEKTASVYENAKLKGGKKGVVCVAIVEDAQAEIALNKAGYTKTIKIRRSDLNDMNSANIENIALGVNGDVMFKNVNEKDIYESVHKLITR